MGKYSTLQLSQLKKINTQLEARLPRTKRVALTHEWRQKQTMRNHQSEHDRIRNELSNSALPFRTQEQRTNIKFEFENMEVELHNIIA